MNSQIGLYSEILNDFRDKIEQGSKKWTIRHLLLPVDIKLIWSIRLYYSVLGFLR